MRDGTFSLQTARPGQLNRYTVRVSGMTGNGTIVASIPAGAVTDASGNGTGEVRAWVAVAGALKGAKTTALAYEPIYEWINGMGVVIHEPKAA